MAGATTKIRLGISTCLLGEKVRFDGGHKRSDLILHTLSKFFEWVPVCPEVEIGLGIPRETLRLVGNVEEPRLVTGRSGIDHTRAMQRFADQKLAQLADLNLHGFILKKDSPTCGMERVRVYTGPGAPQRKGVGLFARRLIEKMPLLPVEEEGRLTDMRLRENFITHVFSYFRWQQLVGQNFEVRKLVDFHARHKFLLMAHSEKHMRLLGKVVANARQYRPEALLSEYASLFFEALRHRSTTRKNTNVLQHILGFLKKLVDDADKRELLQVFDDYHKGLLPLVVPLTLIRHHVNKHDISYISEQVYLNPHPKELMLLNHV